MSSSLPSWDRLSPRLGPRSGSASIPGSPEQKDADIRTQLDQVRTTISGIRKPKSIKAKDDQVKDLFNTVERILKHPARKKELIKELREIVIDGFLKHVVDVEESATNRREQRIPDESLGKALESMQTVFLLAIPSRPGTFSNLPDRFRQVFQWGRPGSPPRYSKIPDEVDQEVDAFHEAVSSLLVDKLIGEIKAMISGSTTFTSKDFGPQSWEYQFLSMMYSVLKERQLAFKALCRLDEYLDNINNEFLGKNFESERAHTGEVGSYKTFFFLDIKDRTAKDRKYMLAQQHTSMPKLHIA